jgi:hypothetical protein
VITLRGGPWDGRQIDMPPGAFLIVPLAHPPRRAVDDDEPLDPYTLLPVDPDARVVYTTHRYNTFTGEYVGMDDTTST